MKTFTIIVCLTLSFQALAQAPRKLKQDTRFVLKIEKPSMVLAPSPLDSATKYPLVVFLPFTGGSANDFFSNYLFQSFSELGDLGHREIDVDLNVLIDSLKRTPTEDEVKAYIAHQAELNAQKESPAEKENFDIFQQILFGKDVKKKAFIALIPDGAGSTNDHSWEGFEACIFRYENKILQDIDSLGKIYNIDHSKIIMAGYSLGGDLGWAISQRYPEKFKGALVNGSRCGYSEKGMTQRQAKQGVKYYIAMGEAEAEVRMKGAKAAVTLLNTAGIKNKFATIPMAGHDMATFEQFREALNFILFE